MEDTHNGFEQRRTPKTGRSVAQRMPRSVSEEVLAMEGKFNPGNIHGTSEETRNRKVRHRG